MKYKENGKKMGRKAQMGTVTFLMLFFLAFSFVTYALNWDAPLFFSLTSCLFNTGTTCTELTFDVAGINITGQSLATIFFSVIILFIAGGVYGISTTGNNFPNPYWYFLPLAAGVTLLGLSIPTKLLSEGYGIPEPLRLLIVSSITFVIGMNMVSWLKGGQNA